MPNTCLKSIKYESIKSIFTSIADADKISRADISAQTNLSLVTVGKIADALLELNVVRQVKEVQAHAGRRAGILSINEEKFALILDITSYNFRIAILGLRLNLIERSAFDYDKTKSYQENLRNFFLEASTRIQTNYQIENCFGVGIAVPGSYNALTDKISTNRIPELCAIPIRSAAERLFPSIPLLIETHTNAAARSNLFHVEDYAQKNVLYWYVASDYVCGAYIVGDRLILGKNDHACDFGQLYARRGMRLEDLIASCTDAATCAENLTGAIYNVLKVLNPHTVIMEFELPFSCENIFGYVRALLQSRYGMDENDIPEFRMACCRFRNSHRGLTIGLRELWLDRIVFGAENN